MTTHDRTSRARILIPLFIGFLIMAVAFVIISYTQFKAYTIDDCVNYAYGLNSLIADDLDEDHINDYVKQGHAYPGYDDIEAHLYKLRAAYPDIRFLYVYQIREDGCHVVFDLDTDDVPANKPGDVVEFDKSYEKYIPDLLAGKAVPPIISRDSFGYLLTIYTPLYDSKGVCQCYAAVDYSMELLIHYVQEIINKIILFFIIVVLLIVAVSVLLTDRGIVKPMRRLESKAFRDTLTGLQNHTAFYDRCGALDRSIASGSADFSMLMIDVNFLKRMNDTHGHERGNAYLQNAAALAGEHFGKDRLYRTGGDEFVAVLEGREQAGTEAMIRAFKEAIARLQADDTLPPWQKVSAAVGLAAFEPGRDSHAEEVLKRADAAMYRDKLAMKAERRD